MSSVFTGVKVFCATMIAQRLALSDQVTAWLTDARRKRPSFQLVDIEIHQSSDRAFHCISVVIFFREAPTVPATKGRTSLDPAARTPGRP